MNNPISKGAQKKQKIKGVQKSVPNAQGNPQPVSGATAQVQGQQSQESKPQAV